MGRQDPFILGQTIGVYAIFLPQKEHQGVFCSVRPLRSPELNRCP